MEQKTNRNKLIGTIAGAVIGVVIAVAVQQSIFKAPSFDKALMEVASELNKSCPMMVDSETRLDNAISLPDNVFQYHYTLINLPLDSIDINDFEEYMKPQILNNIKTNPDMKSFRDNKVTMVYYYKDMNGVFITKISISKDLY